MFGDMEWSSALVTIVCMMIVPCDLRNTFGFPHEYCHLQAFNATCGRNEIIMMRSAMYGRMQVGGCVKRDLGYVGCSVNVMDYMDAQCSGRISCTVPIVSLALLQQPCPEDVTSYLAAQYTCTPVITGTPQICSHQHHITLPPEGGTLSSTSAASYGPGSSQCPWQLTADKGQRINITLLNFARALTSPETADHGPDACYEYAVIRDGDMRKPVVGCAGEQRIHNVYISRTNHVEIHIVDRIATSQALFFALEYQIVGCSDVSVGAGMTAHRIDDSLRIQCNQSQQAWHLTCKGTTWEGEYGNCSGGGSWDLSTMFAGGNAFPYGILIVVSIGVALGVFMGGLLLFAISMYMKRKRPAMPVATEEMIYEEQRSRDKLMSDPDYHGDMTPGYHGDPAIRMIPSRQMHPLPPQPPQGYDPTHTEKMTDSGGGSMVRHSEGKTFRPDNYPTYPRANNHVYESPQFA